MSQLKVEKFLPVANVTLNRPDVHNAFDDTLIAELTEAMKALAADRAVRVIVLAGAGKSFCAGADLAWMQRMAEFSREENVADAHQLAAMIQQVRDMPQPVIARVQGAAFGGALGLIAACDLAFAVESAIFCFSEVKLGLAPAVIAPFVLEKTAPDAIRRYMLTAERFSAQEALNVGLLSQVAATPAELDVAIAGFVDRLLASGPEAQAAVKQLLAGLYRRTISDPTQYTAELIADLRASNEGQEGMQAFFEKRHPKWRDEIAAGRHVGGTN